MARTNTKANGDWFDRMQRLFKIARYSEAATLYDQAVSEGVHPSVDAVLLRSRVLLRSDAEKLTSLLLKDELFDKASSTQLARRAMYLGTGYARLGEFSEADKYLAEAQTIFLDGALLAELSAHIARRHLGERNFEVAEDWREKTLADRSLAGKIRSEHLRSYILARREQYREQAESLMAVLDLIGQKREQFLEDWYLATYGLAVLARELSMPNAATRAKAEVDVDIEWSPDYTNYRFQALKGVAWCQALAGDELNCLRYLRLAGHIAPQPLWQVMLFADRSYFASIVGEAQWAINEFTAAEELSETVEWERTSGEERVALLLLAELATIHAPKRAPYYLARFKELGRLRSHLQHFAFDDRLEAMASYATGAVKEVGGDKEAAEEQYRKAWSIFDRIGYNVRAARAAMGLLRTTGKPRWLHLAEDQLESYPRSWLSRQLAELSPSDGRRVPRLSRMQEVVVRLVCEGLSTDAMAERLKLSRNTILNHLKVAYKKLGVNSRESLFVEALRLGIVRPAGPAG